MNGLIKFGELPFQKQE